jgi:hypothetical protein
MMANCRRRVHGVNIDRYTGYLTNRFRSDGITVRPEV